MPAARWRRLVLVRHGESTWNAAGRIQGHSGGGLTERGRAQAESVAATVAHSYPDVALIARSDLRRVEETAGPAEARLGVPVRVDRRLREIDVGAWAGLTFEEVQERDPDGVAAWRRGEDIGRGGGETFAELRQRVWQAVTELVGTPGGGTVVLFTHGGPIRVAAACALGLVDASATTLGPLANGSLTVLESRAGQIRLAAYNETCSAGNSAPSGSGPNRWPSPG